jgi:dCTP deaminase
MFLGKQEILELSAKLFPKKEEHFNAEFVKAACYDLCVGDEVFLSEDRVPKRLSENSPYILLPPGQFALIKTYEEISIPPNLIGLLSIRSRFKFQGLINISGFHVDPTYRGHLIFAVQNVGPNDIRLQFKEPTFMLMLAKLETAVTEERSKGFYRIPLEQMAQLGGPSFTLATLKRDFDHMSLALKIYGGIAVALIGALVAALLTRGH